MSNRVYLCCTDFSTPPAEGDWHVFGERSGTEYEAAYCIPLYWLCLFGVEDIRLARTQDEEDEQARDYAYLVCERQAGLARLQTRAAALQGPLGAERHALYLQWLARIAQESFSHVLVRTEELDAMDEEGQFQQELRTALSDLDAACSAALETGEFAISPALANLAGFPNPPELQHYEAFVLAGAANSNVRWPTPFAPALQQPAAERVSSPWWKFW
ncbi:MAG: hypothetical protein RLZZ237_2009 [Pseudomonadota bacterium]|jgi:hypothetical protein